MTVERERQEILAAIEGRTLCHLFMETAEAHADAPALSHREGEVWHTRTWADYRREASAAAMGLRSLGVGHRQFVALMMTNRPEHVIADVGAMLAGATPVSVYFTLAPEQIAHVAGNCEAVVAVVEDASVAERWLAVRDQLPQLRHLVLLSDAEDVDAEGVLSWEELLDRGRQALSDDPGALEASWRQVQPEDPATLIYTSGTTGPPKGVVITHRNVLFELEAIRRIVEPPTRETLVSYLPLAHVAERMTSHWSGIRYASHVHFIAQVPDVLQGVLKARPKLFVGVPRVWEKLHAGLLAAIEAEPNARRRQLVQRALAVGTEVVERQQARRPVPLSLRLQHAVFERLVYRRIRERIGLDRCEYPISGAAPIRPELLTFFHGIGLPILEVYGMTETTAVTNANRPGQARIGTVGPPIPGVEVRTAEDGEVLARGPNITPGYWRMPEQTRELIDDEGWCHTGDLGEIDADGYLRIIGRKKELIVTAGGKNISPNAIEELIKRHPLVGQVCVVGDMRPYLVALVVLDPEVAPVWAKEHGIAATSLAELSQNEVVRAAIDEAIAEANRHVSRVEQVKRFAILPTEWTPDSDELTPTLKLRRSVIHEKYADVIDGLYG